MDKAPLIGYIPDSFRKCLVAQYPDRLRQLDAKRKALEKGDAKK